MKHARHFATSSIITGLLVVVAAPARSQQPQKVPSLGDLARQMKAERDKRKQKPVAVFTNDNLPSEESIGNEDGKAKGKKNTPESTSSQASPASEQRGERYFRSKADEIRSRLEFHRRQLNVLQQQLGLARVQYYPDPQKTLEQESTPSFQSDLVKLRGKIAATQKAIDDDQKTMENLREELRREGGDPGWIR
jgi:hypothetical protein